MKILSSIVDTCNVHINSINTMWFKVDGKTYVRKLNVKPFTNHAIVKVRYKNEYYLVDSRLDNVDYDTFQNTLVS